MRKCFFKVVNTFNKVALPKYSKVDPSKLSRIQQVIVGIRYYVLINSLD